MCDFDDYGSVVIFGHRNGKKINIHYGNKVINDSHVNSKSTNRNLLTNYESSSSLF